MLHPDFPFISAFNSELYHLVIPKSFLNCPCLFLWTSRLFRIRRFRFVIVLPLDDPVLPLYLGNIQVRHMKSVLFLHPLLDLLVCSALPKPGHVQVFKREFNSDILTRYVSLGKLDNRLHVRSIWEHVHGLDKINRKTK